MQPEGLASAREKTDLYTVLCSCLVEWRNLNGVIGMTQEVHVKRANNFPLNRLPCKLENCWESLLFVPPINAFFLSTCHCFMSFLCSHFDHLWPEDKSKCKRKNYSRGSNVATVLFCGNLYFCFLLIINNTRNQIKINKKKHRIFVMAHASSQNNAWI